MFNCKHADCCSNTVTRRSLPLDPKLAFKKSSEHGRHVGDQYLIKKSGTPFKMRVHSKGSACDALILIIQRLKSEGSSCSGPGSEKF